VVVELLQPLDDQSPHAEFLRTRGEGMQHLAYLVPDFDEQLAAVRTADPDTQLLIDGTGPGNPFRWVYLDGGAAHGTVIELLERTPVSEATFGGVLDMLHAAGTRNG
jgi:methylmalonyl-CoA/ethylmalonyl-CoA epimerase